MHEDSGGQAQLVPVCPPQFARNSHSAHCSAICRSLQGCVFQLGFVRCMRRMTSCGRNCGRAPRQQRRHEHPRGSYKQAGRHASSSEMSPVAAAMRHVRIGTAHCRREKGAPGVAASTSAAARGALSLPSGTLRVATSVPLHTANVATLIETAAWYAPCEQLL